MLLLITAMTAIPAEVVFFLCCSGEDSLQFESELRALKFKNDIRHVPDPRDIEAEFALLPKGISPVVIVLDTFVEHAWGEIERLKQSRYDHVPVLAICERTEAEEALARGVNAVLPRHSWKDHFPRTVASLTSFWLRVVRVPSAHA